jgi:hypothetical protein
MRTLFLLIPLALIGCNKPDPIEACVEAHKQKLFADPLVRDDPETAKYVITQMEPDWRLKCLEAAAGRVSINQNKE